MSYPSTSSKSVLTTSGGLEVATFAPVQYTLNDGPNPTPVDLEIPAEWEKKISEGGNARVAALEINDPWVNGDQTFNGLFILRTGPGSLPPYRTVTVADHRAFWNHKHCLKRFNMRRTTGYFRIQDPTAAELQLVDDDVYYWAWSLKDSVAGDPDSGTPWTVADIAEWLAQYTHEWVKTYWQEAPEPQITGSARLNRVVPQNFIFDDRLGDCWRRLLSYAPELKIFINQAGRLVVDRRNAQQDAGTIDVAGPNIWGAGEIAESFRGHERPRYIDVLFTNEHEVRFDYVEPVDNTETATTDASLRRLTAVLQVPDFTVGDYVQGDWISYDTAMALWNADKPAGVATGLTIDWPFVRSVMIPYVDFAAALKIVGGDITNADWAGRIDAMQGHFRQSYQIPRAWLDSCISIAAERVAVSNPETGLRALSPVYSDYFRIYGRRNHLRRYNDGLEMAFGSNVTGYPAGDDIDSATIQAPAAPSIQSGDLGILSLRWLVDPLRSYEQVIPGTINSTYHPTGDLQQEERPLTFDSVVDDVGNLSTMPAMDSGYKMAIVLTCIPAREELYRIRVMPWELYQDVPGFSDRDYGGPPMEIRIPASQETARWAWSDDAADSIIARFGIIDADEEVPEDLLLNRNTLDGGAPLDEIARAVALREYWKLQDRPMGSAEYTRNHNAVPSGFLSSVVHSIQENGVVTTRLSYDPDLPQLQLESMLSPGTRAFLMRQAVRGTGR